MENEIIGYGSSFYTPDKNRIEAIKNIDFSDEYVLLYNGRDAINYVILLISKTIDIQTLWMPDYYCPHVKSWLEKRFANIKYYSINPFDATNQPDWKQFNTQTDVVILNNFWGCRSYEIPKENRPIIIEDHSHGWLNASALHSKADYCIASLRKTVPLPMGGIAWIPNSKKTGRSLVSTTILTDYGTNDTSMAQAWDVIQKGMDLKAICSDKSAKNVYLEYFSQGEIMIRENMSTYQVADRHKNQLKEISFKNYGEFKADNLKYLLSKIKKFKSFKIINTDNCDYFGLILVFKAKNALNDLKQYLICHSIYPAELWPENSAPGNYKYLLNIHVDFRYNKIDMEYIAKVVNLWPERVNI